MSVDNLISGRTQDDLHLCATVVEKTVKYLLEEDVPSDIIVSSLIGSSLMLLARTMDRKAIIRILDQAILTVKNDQMFGKETGADMSKT